MTRIALLGAGGKMGVRLATNLLGSRFDVAHVEVSAEGRDRLKQATGVECVDQDLALDGAQVVVLAVPDRLIKTVSHSIVDKAAPGTAFIILDAAAPYGGELPDREDVTYFITHPCHPPIFNDETELDAKNDFFGGIKAKQHIVCALMQGPDEHYALCEEIARTIFKPVMRSHRVTVEQIAILEPALSETVGATFALALKDATDQAVKMGVPEQAAVDFMLGHLNIELSIAFGAFPEGKFSDGALLAIDKAKARIFQDQWLERVFNTESIKASVREICDG
ncbi:MAG: NAD(P)-binding domain-containing protein [Rhodospirillales bacterium]|nr:NAD(P)-binding domain-containing protein [Rhodospirillales bacterium]